MGHKISAWGARCFTSTFWISGRPNAAVFPVPVCARATTSLPFQLELVDEGVFSLETVVQKMCHAPARIYGICQRGYIREGYQADLVLVRPNSPWEVTTDKILSKCGWSPLEGHTFNWKVEKTFANGHLIYNGNTVNDSYRGEELRFDYPSAGA